LIALEVEGLSAEIEVEKTPTKLIEASGSTLLAGGTSVFVEMVNRN